MIHGGPTPRRAASPGSGSRSRAAGAPGAPRTRTFGRAVACALRGVGDTARTQAHFRVHLGIAAIVMLAGAWAGLGGVELAVLSVTVALVLAAEMLNTAVERLTDIVHPENGPLAAAVKDASAGGVLVAAALAVAVGALVFVPHLRGGVSAVRGIPVLVAAGCLAALAAGAAGAARRGG